MTQPPERARAITVTQADRNRAASYHMNTGGTGYAAKLMQDGHLDDNEEVQAFARHRSEGVREAVERCAAIAREAHAADLRDYGQFCTDTSADIATAILATLSPKEGA